ncbi:phosphatidylinositol phosphate synthase [Mumia zhuanghuii]|uniref:Phosphatidylinositol phosphate synthase n=1 Tax=Mumia zhuanghuii TaxID=2585211 RepID=A0A5C4MA22_9ACTN|nr:CDP-alcohol phosphatidyltransferase family protein [Mumia zhuanghuii]TNC29828.1 CDP-alcohol phosphatidyltransferase family protein [Mumia zhuanghuii]TNC37123.1 CDP-alcohol phosphatidyltransferase family protein [Mumia zhuanghuii]
MLERFRATWAKIMSPIADLFLKLGISPDVVTFVGTLGVTAAALWFYPRGEFFLGTVVITAFVFSDMVDGLMARKSGQSSAWGAFLDSTLDRIGDAAIFGGLVVWYAGTGDDLLMTSVALWCLVGGQLTSYARARAESLGMQAKGGIAERSDRLVAVLAMTGLSGIFDLPVLRTIVLWALAVASTVTVVQRIMMVRRQALAKA